MVVSEAPEAGIMVALRITAVTVDELSESSRSDMMLRRTDNGLRGQVHS